VVAGEVSCFRGLLAVLLAEAAEFDFERQLAMNRGIMAEADSVPTTVRPFDVPKIPQLD